MHEQRHSFIKIADRVEVGVILGAASERTSPCAAEIAGLLLPSYMQEVLCADNEAGVDSPRPKQEFQNSPFLT